MYPGGEWTGSIVYIYEQAPRNRRGMYVSLNTACEVGFLGATGVAALLRGTLSPAQLDSWGWRIPFFCGILAAVFGVWMRKGLGESEEFATSAKHNVEAPLKSSFRDRVLVGLLYGVISQSFVAYYLVWVFLPTYLTNLRPVPLSQAFLINMIAMLFYKVAVVFFGYLGDIWHRGFLLQTGSVLIFLFAPMFFLIFSAGGVGAVLVAELFLVAILSLFEGNVPSFMVQALPDVTSRYTSFGISYNLAAATIGGTTPLIATALATKISPVMPGILYSCIALVTFLCVTQLRARHEKTSFSSVVCQVNSCQCQLDGNQHEAIELQDVDEDSAEETTKLAQEGGGGEGEELA